MQRLRLSNRQMSSKSGDGKGNLTFPAELTPETSPDTSRSCAREAVACGHFRWTVLSCGGQAQPWQEAESMEWGGWCWGPGVGWLGACMWRECGGGHGVCGWGCWGTAGGLLGEP